MAYDGSVLKNVVFELNEKLKEGRIDKIYQPEKDEIILNIRNKREKYKLLLSASSSNPRAYITSAEKENPQTPPTFCMLLRKHLEGARIVDFEQYKMDRIMKMNVISKNELGDEITKSLIIEIMGKYSNIILVNSEDNKIMDSIKRVNASMSRVREILPGLIYEVDSISDKKNPLDETKEGFIEEIENTAQNKRMHRFLMNTYTGISPFLGREIVKRAGLQEEFAINVLDSEMKEQLFEGFSEVFKELSGNEYNPTIIYDEDKIVDFSAIDIKLYPESEKKHLDSISELLDGYFIEKDNKDRIANKSGDIKKLVKNQLDKDKNKLEKQTNEYDEAMNREKFKVWADLISANLWKIEKGAKSIEVENFYDEMNLVEVPLNERYSASENANRYYKKYSKLKSAAIRLKSEIEKSKSSIEYLESVLLNIELSDDVSDIEEIREELSEMGYIRKSKNKKKKKKNKESKFMEFDSVDGYKILVGKNNKQNDELTLKKASRDDQWFHVKGGAGSHVIIKNNGEPISEEGMVEAAKLAAYYSSYRNSSNVEVDTTVRKNIKRHPAKIPGLVIYVDFSTIIV